MTKAEERAFEFLPIHPNAGLEKQRKRFRQMYEAGYEQAEKDFQKIIKYIEDTLRCIDHRRGYHDDQQSFCLSPEDIGKIFNKVRELQVKYNATEACFEEVAEWFNNLKEEKK